jgi:hypothetical protein
MEVPEVTKTMNITSLLSAIIGFNYLEKMIGNRQSILKSFRDAEI